MKKILGLVLLSLLFGGMVVTLPGMAQARKEIAGPPACCKLRRDATVIDDLCTEDTVVAESIDDQCDLGIGATTPNWGACCLFANIKYATDFIFFGLLLVSVITVLIGGFMMVTAMGSQEQFGKGRVFVKYAVIGLAVAFAARLVPTVARWIIGM